MVAEAAPAHLLAALRAHPAGARAASAGNAALAGLLVQRYEMREYQGATPAGPYTQIHFRFDDVPLSGHQFLHITFQNGDRSRTLHYYYDSWTDVWTRSRVVPADPLDAATLNATKAAAIVFATYHAGRPEYRDRVVFRPPAAAAAAAPQAGFVPLGSMTAKEVARAAQQRQRADEAAERKRLKAAEAQVRRDAEAAARAAKRAEEDTRRFIADGLAAADHLLAEPEQVDAVREAALAALAYDFQVAFGLQAADARARAEELLTRERKDRTSGRTRPMSEAAADMYG